MTYLKVEIFVPEEYVRQIADGLNGANLIQEGNYDYCFSYAKVKGHFRPLEDAQPFSGEVGELNQVDEVKMECRIEANQKEQAEAIIRLAHPYEVPVINFIQLS